MSRILFISPADDFAGRLVDALGPAAEERVDQWWVPDMLAESELAAGRIGATKPAVVLLGPDLEEDRGLALADALRRSHPEVTTLLVAEDRPDLYASAMRAGISDILNPGASAATIRDRVGEALSRWDKLQATTQAAAEASAGSIVTMIEPKGGSGKTSVITNLAVVLSQQFPGEVVLVDLDLQFGDAADALLLDPRYTMADVAKTSPLDATTLKALLTRRDGLFVLCAPMSPADADDIGSALIAEVLDLLARDFAWVLVDTAGGLTEPTLTAAELSTDLILLTSLDVLATKSMATSIRILDDLGIIVPRRHLVLNRSDSRVGLDRTEAIMNLGMRRAVEIPSGKEVPLSLNKGQPLVEMQPRSQIARRIADLAAELVQARESSQEWRG